MNFQNCYDFQKLLLQFISIQPTLVKRKLKVKSSLPLFCVSAVCNQIYSQALYFVSLYSVMCSLYSVSLLYVIKYILRASLLSLIFLSVNYYPFMFIFNV